MTRTVPLAIVVTAVVAFSAAGCRESDDNGALDPGTVATVAGEPITVDEVRALVRDEPLPPVKVAGEENLTLAQEATERAIRDELLVREAARRGITGQSRADQIARLVAEERRDTDNLDTATIDDREVRSWYQEHISEVGTVARADVAWAKVLNGELADTLFEQVENSDQETFLRVVREAGAADSGTATVHGEGESSVDTMVVRAAFGTGFTGGVGLAEDPTNKQWWLVRVGEISFEEVNWDAATTRQVKSAMAAQCENEHLRRLADSLRERWPVHVDEARLADIDLRETPR